VFLACVPNEVLLAEQVRVHDAVRSLAVDPWPYFGAGSWTPHITTGWALPDAEFAAALPIVLASLPITGWLDRGGVEDGTTGEYWPAATR
jgi:hypothetical protein